MVGLRMKHEETCVAAGKQKNYKKIWNSHQLPRFYICETL